MLNLIGGLLGGIGGMIGNKSKQTESFEKTTDSTTTANSQDLSPELLKSLEGLFSTILGSGGFEQATGAIGDRLSQMQDRAGQDPFDSVGFAEAITARAAKDAGLALDSSINSLLSSSGGSASGNSMNALLSNNIRNQTARELAGIGAEARATGEGIELQEQTALTESIMGLGTSLTDQILGLIAATRGASKTGESKTHEVSKGTGTSTGTEKKNPFSAFGDIFGSFASARESA